MVGVNSDESVLQARGVQWVQNWKFYPRKGNMEILPHKIFFGLIDFKTLPFLYLFLGNCVNDGF